MITYLLGLPGSGKSYYAVYSIYYNFGKDLDNKKKNSFKKDYLSCYTNVNGLKFDMLENVYHLNWDILSVQIKELHELYKARDKLVPQSEFDSIDDLLISKAKEYNIYKTLFVIDEAHNFFDVQSAHLVWWLTYHRHLHHDLFLITQNLALINSKYKPLGERFLRAKPASLSLLSKYFYYTYFTDQRLTKAGKVEVIKIPKDPKVFEIYQSGDSVKTKNVILKFLSISAFLFVLLAIAFYFYIHSKVSKDVSSPAPVYSSNSEVESSQVSEIKASIPDDPVLISLTCDDSTCSVSFSSYYFNKDTVFTLLDSYSYRLLSVDNIADILHRYNLLVSNDFVDVLKSYSMPNNEDTENIKSKKSNMDLKVF